MKKNLICIMLILCSFVLNAQITKIKGRVVDEKTNEALPFVAIYFKGLDKGCSTDLDGKFFLEIRNLKIKELRAFLLGYEEKIVELKLQSFNNLEIKLTPVHKELTEAVVKPDNHYLNSILRKINQNKEKNDPDLKEHYNCDTYSKVEFDLQNAKEQLNFRAFKEHFSFVNDYIDTSVVSGKAYLPVMISETIARKYHQKSPSINKEKVLMSKLAGIERNQNFVQYTSSVHLNTNLYQNFISVVDVQIPSPLNSTGRLYYNYFLIDSTAIQGRKTYKIRFHPKKLVPSPVFDGEIMIDAEDFALKSANVKLQKGTNVNWVRDLVIEVENERLSNGSWFFKDSKVYLDFSVSLSNYDKLLSFIARRNVYYSNVNWDEVEDKNISRRNTNIVMEEDVLVNEEEKWAKVRPYELSPRERGVYQMVNRIKDVPLYKDIYSTITTVVTGYFEKGKIGIGPYSRFVSFNNLEGVRLRVGMKTTKEFSRKMRITGHVAYGTRDKHWKGSIVGEYMFSKIPTRKLTVDLKHDAIQLGQGMSDYNEQNFFVSLFSKKDSDKRSHATIAKVRYDREWVEGIDNSFEMEFKQIYGSRFVPLQTFQGEILPYVLHTKFLLNFRFAWDETFNRGLYVRKSLGSRKPIINFNFLGGASMVGKNWYPYFRPEFDFSYKFNIPPLGHSSFSLNAGIILGKVPYTLLKIHEANTSFFFKKQNFSCMNYFEFASDRWVSIFYEHNFRGFFLGKIPLLRHLQLREAFSFRMAYGAISQKNNGQRGIHGDALLVFPEEMKSLNIPYVELGVGVTNILRIMRVDCFWRMTHRDHRPLNKRRIGDNVTINIGVELKF